MRDTCVALDIWARYCPSYMIYTKLEAKVQQSWREIDHGSQPNNGPNAETRQHKFHRARKSSKEWIKVKCSSLTVYIHCVLYTVANNFSSWGQCCWTNKGLWWGTPVIHVIHVCSLTVSVTTKGRNKHF